MSDPVVVIGSGLAAYTFAKEFRKHDPQTELVIITQSRGDFYSKPQLSTALTKNQTASSLALHPVSHMQQQLNATIMTEVVVSGIDRDQKKVFADNVEQPYGKLVLAVGAKPIVLRLAGEAGNGLLSVNNLEDYAVFEAWLKNKKRISIIGTGLVGSEFMNDLLNTDHHLTMISLESTPLARLIPAELGKVVQSVFADAGVDWVMNASAESLHGAAEEYVVGLTSGRELRTDGVLSAVGLRANIELAQQAGLEVNRGIKVDRYLASSDPNIFAVGDCAEVEGLLLQYVAPLLHAGRALGKTVAGEPTQVQYPPMPVVIKTPTCPVVTIPPLPDTAGQWQISGDQSSMEALFYDDAGQLRGFALVAAAVKRRMELAKAMLPAFTE